MRTSHLTSALIDKFALVAERSLECLDAAKLLGEAEAMAAIAPRIRVPAACSAPETLRAIPLLMRGSFRLGRFRLLRGYLRSIRGDMRHRLSQRADDMALSGKWKSFCALHLTLRRAEMHTACLHVLGILFLLHIPVRFEPECTRLARLLGSET
jgi:hypothetical protein